MAIAAVPAYLARQDFEHASAGMRFEMLLPIWGEQDFQLLKTGKPLQSACNLTTTDHAIQQALINRMANMAVSAPNVFTVSATATAPFTTGLGHEHPLENGFSFLDPYGLPYLPASSIKGVLREAASQLASGLWEDDGGWVAVSGCDMQSWSTIDLLFGTQPIADDTEFLKGVLSFWDVIPSLPDNSRLAVEIMTPHHSHYYQQTESDAFTTPHDSGQPNPIQFLTIPPEARFTFHVQCDHTRLARLAPQLLTSDRWQTLLKGAFEHAFMWLGFGAKTATGYGSMISDEQANLFIDRQKKQAEAERLQEKIEAEARQQATAEPIKKARIRFNRANGALTVESKGKQVGIAYGPQGKELLASLPANLQNQIRSNAFVRVTAYVAEGVLVRIEL